MPFVCIFLTRVRGVSKPSTSYMRTSSNAEALGGLLSGHCQGPLRPGCQHPGHATGAATRGGATVRTGIRLAAAAAGDHAAANSTTQSRVADASRFLTDQVSALARRGLDLTGRRSAAD